MSDLAYPVIDLSVLTIVAVGSRYLFASIIKFTFIKNKKTFIRKHPSSEVRLLKI
jgi:hypothetical protein